MWKKKYEQNVIQTYFVYYVIFRIYLYSHNGQFCKYNEAQNDNSSCEIIAR